MAENIPVLNERLVSYCSFHPFCDSLNCKLNSMKIVKALMFEVSMSKLSKCVEVSVVIN